MFEYRFVGYITYCVVRLGSELTVQTSFHNIISPFSSHSKNKSYIIEIHYADSFGTRTFKSRGTNNNNPGSCDKKNQEKMTSCLIRTGKMNKKGMFKHSKDTDDYYFNAPGTSVKVG